MSTYNTRHVFSVVGPAYPGGPPALVTVKRGDLETFVRKIADDDFPEPISGLIQQIRGESDKEKRNKLKRSLPAAVTGGVFAGSHEKKDFTGEYSWLMPLDFDAVGDVKAAAMLRDDLREVPNVVAAFISASGTGVKAFLRLDAPDGEEVDDFKFFHESRAFPQARDFLLEHTGLEIDKTGKNLNRLCFASWDDGAWYNGETPPFIVSMEMQAQLSGNPGQLNSGAAPTDGEPVELDDIDASNACRYILHKLRADKNLDWKEGLRNEFTVAFAYWANSAGVPLPFAERFFAEHFGDRQDFDEFLPRVGNAYNGRKEERGRRPLSFTGGPPVQFVAKNGQPRQRPPSDDDEPEQSAGQSARKRLPATLKGAILELMKPLVFGRVISDEEIFANLLARGARLYDPEKQRGEALAIIEEHDFLRGAWRWDEKKDGTRELKKREIFSAYVADRYTRQYLQPRNSQVYGWQIWFMGEWRGAETEVYNAVESLLAHDYGLKLEKDAIKKAVKNIGNVSNYCPLVDWFDKAAETAETADGEEAFEEFMAIFEDRLDADALPLPTARLAVKTWCALVVAQVESPVRPNDFALGCVSETQGTGKTTFVKSLMHWAYEVKAAGSAVYNVNLPETRRAMAKLVFMLDDESSRRSNSEIADFKEALSFKELSFRQLYQENFAHFKRLASYAYCSNNTGILREPSRRDLILPFKEESAHGLDWSGRIRRATEESLQLRMWGYFVRLWREQPQTVEAWAAELKIYFSREEVTNRYMERSAESDLIQKYLQLPDPGAKQLCDYNLSAAGVSINSDDAKYDPRFFTPMSVSEVKQYLLSRGARNEDNFKQELRLYFGSLKDKTLENALKQNGFQRKKTRVEGQARQPRLFHVCFRKADDPPSQHLPHEPPTTPEKPPF